MKLYTFLSSLAFTAICFLYSSLVYAIIYSPDPDAYELFPSRFAFMVGGLFYIFWIYLLLIYIYLKFGGFCKKKECHLAMCLLVFSVIVIVLQLPDALGLRFNNYKEVDWIPLKYVLMYLSNVPLLYFLAQKFYFDR